MTRPNRVPVGRLIATPEVASAMRQHPDLALMVGGWLADHLRGVCPHLDAEDQAANARAVSGGDRILTAWPTGLPHPEDRLWIITEADRSATTLLWPSEY